MERFFNRKSLVENDPLITLFYIITFINFCPHWLKFLAPPLFAVIAGAMMLGLKLVFITIHPMKWGATLMNSFLFNVGLILLCSIRSKPDWSDIVKKCKGKETIEDGRKV
ncbi:U-box domain-containing protein [Abeliophyllum distichum]|uniref:U-box domain-containing protein n=1 Tax=Abeliophyllum distichum TaxID=126358 RepID=A0ABD1QWQ5_9LAMI